MTLRLAQLVGNSGTRCLVILSIIIRTIVFGRNQSPPRVVGPYGDRRLQWYCPRTFLVGIVKLLEPGLAKDGQDRAAYILLCVYVSRNY